MKRMKKLLAVLLTVAMVMSMGMSVLAASEDDTCTITITNTTESETHTYYAYQIFKGVVESDTMSVTGWGTGISDSTALLNALKNDTTNTTYAAYFTDVTTAAGVATVLNNHTSDDNFAKWFANIVSGYLTTNASDYTTITYNNGYSATVTVGYYLIKDSTTSSEGDAVSDYLLKVVGDTTMSISTKEDVTSLTKEIVDSDVTYNNGSNTSTTASTIANEGYVKYNLTATLPTDISDYSSYYLKFEDTLTGLALCNDSGTYTVKVYANNVTDDNEITSSATVTGTDGGTSLSVVISDVKIVTYGSGITNTVTGGDKIIVVYYAKYTYNASYAGNTASTNTAKVTYSNDPNNASSYGTTKEPITYTYTTNLTVNKVTSSGTWDSTLSGVGFTLYQEVTDSADADGYLNTNGTYVSGTAGYETGCKYVKVVKQEQTISTGSTTFTGLAAGTYILVESTTPSGYNTIAPQTITLSYTYDETTGTLTWSGDSPLTCTDGLFSISITNSTGSNLPTTGGIGTTIFYIVGAVLVLGAGVILITRRRMATK